MTKRYGRKIVGVSSSQLSGKNVIAGSKSNSKAYNAMWSVANKAPLFLRKPKYIGTGKERKRATMVRFGKVVPVPQKTNRCARRHPIRVLISGAAAECADILERENDTLRVDADGEREKAPFLPALQPGAELLLEHAFKAYAQTIFDRANRIREAVNAHKKVTVGSMQAASEITNRYVFASTSMCPGALVIETHPSCTRKGLKKAGADGATEAGAEAVAADA
jgi:hypothetical protein